jgi:hypothetical protein
MRLSEVLDIYRSIYPQHAAYLSPRRSLRSPGFNNQEGTPLLTTNPYPQLPTIAL